VLSCPALKHRGQHGILGVQKGHTVDQLQRRIWFDHISTSEQSHVERPTRKVLFMAMFENARLNYKVPVDVIASGHMPRGPSPPSRWSRRSRAIAVPGPMRGCSRSKDHVAEKICAMYERYRTGGNPSTRHKDLVDLALFALFALFALLRRCPAPRCTGS
jgi:hypothetical protein